jgi:hypothetical protein
MDIWLWGIQVVACVSTIASCETSTSCMLLDCKCTFSTCETNDDHI